MKQQQIKLFLIYSISIVLTIAAFSVAIFYSTSWNEQQRIEDAFIRDIQVLISSKATTEELNRYTDEQNIAYFIWNNNSGDLTVQRKNTNLSIEEIKPVNVNRIEQLTMKQQAIDQLIPSTVTLYSYSVYINGGLQILQIIKNGSDSINLLDNLANRLWIGSIIVSSLGIIFGVVLSQLNILPIMKAWKEQRAFVADASHELRTPLSIITLKSDALLAHSSDSINYHLEDIVMIQKECRRMQKMVNDLLFLAKTDSGVMGIELQAFELAQLMQELEILYSEFFAIEHKHLLFALAPQLIVIGDYEKIKQVCMIIIDNALRFTAERDYIKISAEHKNNKILITIANNGIPLDSKDIPFIFRRFYKSSTSRLKVNGQEGNGLGLSIAQEIMNLHQSKIKAVVVQEETQFSFMLAKGKLAHDTITKVNKSK